MADDRDDNDELLGGAERDPVIGGVVYLLLVIAGVCGVVFWLVMRSTG